MVFLRIHKEGTSSLFPLFANLWTYLNDLDRICIGRVSKRENAEMLPFRKI